MTACHNWPQRLFAVSQSQTPSFLFYYFLSFSSLFLHQTQLLPTFLFFVFPCSPSSKLSERVRSSGKHLPPAAGKRAQVDFDPFSPSPFEEAPLPFLEGTFLCGFSSMILNFTPFLVYSKSPVGILASNVSAYNVGASKEGLALIFWDSLFFDLLELLEGCQFP
ncbi:unnamed protein product [Prunus brigantina]